MTEIEWQALGTVLVLALVIVFIYLNFPSWIIYWGFASLGFNWNKLLQTLKDRGYVNNDDLFD